MPSKLTLTDGEASFGVDEQGNITLQVPPSEKLQAFVGDTDENFNSRHFHCSGCFFF